MIRSIRDAGLKRLFERQDCSKLPQQHLGRIRRALQLLAAAGQPARLLSAMYANFRSVGPWAGYWSLRVSANWRIVLR
ncbi:MAG: type II toxin-antitoxin system RelE/ParE family toxin [Bryobacterales bacterium]|nr:type II toxin-antitoxin system RelE/ParE family toxin [Bryobacterales bacterium]